MRAKSIGSHAMAEASFSAMHKCTLSSDFEAAMDDWVWDLCDVAPDSPDAAAVSDSRESNDRLKDVVEFEDYEKNQVSFVPQGSADGSRLLLGTGQGYFQGAGPPPSLQEAAEAVDQLYAVLNGRNAARVKASRAGFAARLVEGVRRREGSSCVENGLDVVTGGNEGQSRMCLVVSDAVYLFCVDKELQGVVTSVAHDPAVWTAIGNNPQVRNFLRRRAPSLVSSSPPSVTSSVNQQSDQSNATDEMPSTPDDDSPATLTDVVQQLLHSLLHLPLSVWSFLAGLFEFQNSIGEDEEEDMVKLAQTELEWKDGTVASSLVVLVVLVVGIILFKRPIPL